MTQLAVRNGAGLQANEPRPAHAVPPAFSIDEVWRMAEDVARSGLFPGAKTPEQAFTMMLICQADGLHPINAVRRFHVIEGRPSMRADAIQAEFQARGGRVRWVESTADVCVGEFSHPKYHPEPFPVRMELARFVENKVAMTYDEKSRSWNLKKNWKNWPDAMLRARAVSAGVRAVDPGVVVGLSSEEEAQDIIAIERPAPFVEVQLESAREASAVVAAADVPVMGYHGTGPDARQYRDVVADGVATLNDLVREAFVSAFGDDKGAPKPAAVPDAHQYLINRAVQSGKIGVLPPTKPEQFAALKALYANERDWVRSELTGYLAGELEKAHALVAGRLEAERAQAAPEEESQEAAEPEEPEEPEEPGSRG